MRWNQSRDEAADLTAVYQTGLRQDSRTFCQKILNIRLKLAIKKGVRSKHELRLTKEINFEPRPIVKD